MISRLPRILFARVGWCEFYDGRTGDEPTGGGSYNDADIGSEHLNFRASRGLLRGHVQPTNGRITVRRIDPHAEPQHPLDHVLVLFVATDPTHAGQYVVGWYGDATVFGTPRTRPDGSGHVFNLIATTRLSTLLPPASRDRHIPKGKDGFGQSNIYYPHDEHGRRRQYPWIMDAIALARQYQARVHRSKHGT